MIPAPIPENEEARLSALRKLAILDTAKDERFDRFTTLAARLFDVPIAQISLIDEHRQWIKSCFGADMQETERSTSFCGHTIASELPMIVPDASRDPRFHDNPFVLGEPKVRFYAGYPICAEDVSLIVGSVCIVDTRPRLFLEEDRKLLRDLAGLVREEFLRSARELIVYNDERLSTLLTYSSSGFFDDHFEMGKCYFSPRWKEILGYEDSELANHYDTFLRLVNREDLKDVTRSLTPVAPGTTPFSMEFRMRHKKGHWVWIESRGITSADHQLRPRRHLGFISDITARREATERLRLLELCFERIADGVLIIDAELAPATLSIVHANPGFERFTGHAPADLIGTDPFLLSGAFQLKSALIQKVFAEKAPFQYEGESIRRDGDVLRAQWTVSPMLDPEGRPTHLLVVLRDLSQPHA